MNYPTLSLVTGTRNRPDSFYRLLESIERHAVVSWELVVSDASDAPLACNHPQVRLLPERPRLGCTKGYNRAFREAKGEWVIWLNDDAEVLPGFDHHAIAFMLGNPKVGLGALTYHEDQEPHRGFHVNSYFGMVYANFGILRPSLGNQVGWFDEDLIMYGSDNSLAFRILQAGYGVRAISEARVIHHCEQDRERVVNDVQAVRIQAVHILKDKYGPSMAAMRATYLAAGGIIGGVPDQTPQWAANQV